MAADIDVTPETTALAPVNPEHLIAKACPQCGRRLRKKEHEHCSHACWAKTWKAQHLEPEYVRRRFWQRVRQSRGCWLWMGSRIRAGYGYLSICKKPEYAHRLSWRFAHGPIPAGLSVLHRCDNPPCVRPDHLFLGTHADNVADAVKKNRIRHSEDHGLAKLTTKQAVWVRKRYADGETLATLAKRTRMSVPAIHALVQGRTWRRVGGPIVPYRHREVANG